MSTTSMSRMMPRTVSAWFCNLDIARLISVCQKTGIYMKSKNKWRFKIAKKVDIR